MATDIEESGLVAHARRELELLGEDPEMTEHLLSMVRLFSEEGHSGFSAAYAISRLGQLLRFENLTPLTSDPDEWMHHGPDVWGAEGGIWQSRRRPDAFSTDGGKTFYLVDEQPRVTYPSLPKGDADA